MAVFIHWTMTIVWNSTIRSYDKSMRLKQEQVDQSIISSMTTKRKKRMIGMTIVSSGRWTKWRNRRKRGLQPRRQGSFRLRTIGTEDRQVVVGDLYMWSTVMEIRARKTVNRISCIYPINHQTLYTKHVQIIPTLPFSSISSHLGRSSSHFITNSPQDRHCSPPHARIPRPSSRDLGTSSSEMPFPAKWRLRLSKSGFLRIAQKEHEHDQRSLEMTVRAVAGDRMKLACRSETSDRA